MRIKVENKERVKCCERVAGLSPYHDKRQCSRWAVVTRDGKPYCRQHDPERIKESRAIPWNAGVTYSGKPAPLNIKEDRSVQQLIEDGDLQGEQRVEPYRTLSRETAIKLVEAADAARFVSWENMQEEQLALIEAIKAAKRELGI